MAVTAKDTRAKSASRGCRPPPTRSGPRGLAAAIASWAARPDVHGRLLLAMFASCMVLGLASWTALLAGDGRLALVTVATALPFAVAALLLPWSVPDISDETGTGEVSNLSGADFERLVEQVERFAKAAPVPPAGDGDHFEQLVRDALDELPRFLQEELRDNVAVLIADDGAGPGYYGLYSGATVAHRGDFACVIVIYRDTLVRDFGHDADELRRQVALVVRHEVAHHLGASERRVAEFGL